MTEYRFGDIVCLLDAPGAGVVDDILIAEDGERLYHVVWEGNRCRRWYSAEDIAGTGARQRQDWQRIAKNERLRVAFEEIDILDYEGTVALMNGLRAAMDADDGK